MCRHMLYVSSSLILWIVRVQWITVQRAHVINVLAYIIIYSITLDMFWFHLLKIWTLYARIGSNIFFSKKLRYHIVNSMSFTYISRKLRLPARVTWMWVLGSDSIQVFNSAELKYTEILLWHGHGCWYPTQFGCLISGKKKLRYGDRPWLTETVKLRAHPATWSIPICYAPQMYII